MLKTYRVDRSRNFPVSDEDTIESRIARGFREVVMIEKGELPKKSAFDFLNEL